MYRLQVYYGKTWKWGVKTYASLEEALSRVQQLSTVGIKARPKPLTELYK